MRKVIPIPILNLTSITLRTVQSHLYNHGYTTLVSDLELYHGSNHVAFHYLSREIWYSICCCAKKWLFIVSSTGGIFLHALPKIKIHWVLAHLWYVCNWSAKPPFLKSVGEVICTIYHYGYPHSLCPPTGPPFSPFQSQGFSTGKPDLNLTKNSMTIKVRQKWICLYKDEKTCRPKLICYLKFNNYSVYNTNI